MSALTSRLVLAPMAGGPSTVELAVSVARAGGFAFLAGAYLTVDRLWADIREMRLRTSEPFGVNVFAPSPDEPGMTEAARAYAGRLAPWAAAAGVRLGEPHYSDDDFASKVDVLVEERPALVSFAFGWPPAAVVARLQEAGVEVWVTLNDPSEVEWALALGADGVVAQGWQAGGHRGGPVDTGVRQPSTRDLLGSLRSVTDLPVLATGGVMDGREAATLIEAGADAVGFGTAYLLADEAGTAPVHRHALGNPHDTVVTRAFTGRSARAVTTSWTELFTHAAPTAYPHVHFVTAPLRAYGKASGQADLVHLWAGMGHSRAVPGTASDITRRLLAEMGAG